MRLMGGVVAVQAFYIISGFYMALILNTKYVGAGAYRVFIGNRFLRIYPVYWVVLILTVVLSCFSSLHTCLRLGRSTISEPIRR